MDKKLYGVLGAASALALMAGGAATARAEPSAPMQPAQSFAELLDPIPHAAETLAAIDENSAEAPEPAIRLAQADHHHHHHHYRRYHHHHHHHHHHYHHHHRVIIEKHY